MRSVLHFVLMIVVLIPAVALAAKEPTAKAKQEAPEDAASAETIAGAWDPLLAEHVRPGHLGGTRLALVDYAALAEDSRWPELLEKLAHARIPEDKQARLAFWLNAYNIMAIKVVVAGYPTDRITNLDAEELTVWKKPAGKVAGKTRSLDEIEHMIIRPMGDPRIHAALVCAAKSCPDLRRKAYRPERLDFQLNDQMLRWLASEEKGARFSREGNTLLVSSIFDWFGEDFTETPEGLRGWLKRYLPPEKRARFNDRVQIDFLEYDWTLNDVRLARQQ